MSAKLLGTAVGVALENQEAIRNASAPAMNMAGGVGKVIWGTWWKSTVVGLGLLVVWFASFAFTYILGGTTALGDPTLMALFGVFLFVVMPALVMVREAKRVSKAVNAKNRALKEQAQAETAAREAEYARGVAEWRERQAHEATLDPKFQPQQ